ncbi:DNA resolvase [Ochrobactrum sp. MYb29]|nr:DNA resolvase [Ochrobactrum sp. MYb29]
MKTVRILKQRQRKHAVNLKKSSDQAESNILPKPRKIGYARVSTEEQKVDLQLNALKQAGCEQIFVDEGVSGAKADRVGLKKVLASLQPGDTLVVWRLDRLGRSLINLVGLMSELGKRGVEFHSLMENIDTMSAGGRLVFHLMAALAEFERSLISERTKAGMEAAKLKGIHVGRPRGSRMKHANRDMSR